MRNKALLLIAGAMVIGAAGCADRGGVEVSQTSREEVVSGERAGAPVRVANRLDCPDREGDLRLVSTAADGRSCAYRDEDGAEVELRLTSADGAAELASLETELRGLIPAAAAPPEPPEPPLPPAPPSPDEPAGEDSARVKVGGVIDIRTEGERASIRLPGVRVEANGEDADVRIGGRGGDDVFIRANNGGAEIRARENTRGELTSTFLLASEKPGPAGWRVAGYQARGASDGPLVVGVMRARQERRDGLMNDVDDMVRRNVED